MSTPNNEPERAFPHHETNSRGEPYHDHLGMKLRDYFAAKAMEKLIDVFHGDEYGYLKALNGLEKDHDKWVSKRAYEIADAMILARNGGTKNEQ